MKRLLLLLGITFSANFASAATIEWGSGGSRGHMFVLGNGSRVAPGSLVRIGYFETPGNTSSTFFEFGTTTLATPGGDAVGGYIPAAGQAVTSNQTTFAGRQLYLWVYNAPTAAAATQQEIFTSVEWVTPNDFNTAASVYTLKIGAQAGSGVVNPVVTSLQGAGDADPGSYTVGPIIINGTSNATGSIYRLGLIPEPSAALMGALVGLGLLVRRRR